MGLNRIRDFIRRNVVDTVPNDVDMCLSCGKPACSAADFTACRPRLDRAAELGRAAVYDASTAFASRTTASSAPGAKGDASPAEATRPVKGAEPPRPQSAT